MRLSEKCAAWYAIQVRPKTENITSDILAAKGYECLLPVTSDKDARRSRSVPSERPLFPGYVFCLFDPQNPARLIGTPNVLRVLGNGLQPYPLECHEVEAIRRIGASSLSTRVMRHLVAGQTIEILRGPLKGVRGVLQSSKGESTLVISIAILQRSVSIAIDPSWLADASLFYPRRCLHWPGAQGVG
jgi:transcriptional antiterminator NusG